MPASRAASSGSPVTSTLARDMKALFKHIAIYSCIAFAFYLFTGCFRSPSAIDNVNLTDKQIKEQRDKWIKDSKELLTRRGAPTADIIQSLEPDKCVANGFLFFETGWASFACYASHHPRDIGDIALLLASDGQVYVSSFHFCGGEYDLVSSQERRPKSIPEFLEQSRREQNWIKIP